MAIRLQGGFTSTQTNSVYVFNIHDSSYSGTVIPFDVARDGVSLDYNHLDKGRNVTIMTSKLKIRMLVENQNIKDFLTDVVGSAEERFIIEVLKDGSKYWYGYVIPDLLDLQDIPFSLNPVLTINATDGIGRLKEIDYNNSGTAYSGKQTFTQHLFNILGKIGFDSFYSTSEDYLVTYVDWWNEEHTYLNTSNPLDLSRFDHKALLEIDQSGDIQYLSAFEVLEQLVKAWNCRFMYSNGAYYLVQINSYETNSGTKVIRRYDKDQTKSTTSTTDFSIWNKSTGSLNGYQGGTYDNYHNNGRFRYYPALRQSRVIYEHFTTDNLIPGYTWNESQSPTATFSDLDYNSGAARLYFYSTIESRAYFPDPEDLQILTYHFRITFQVGTKYLKRDWTWTNGTYKYGPTTWSSTLAYYNVFTEYMYTNNFPRITEVPIETPLLEEGGDVSVNIAWFATYNTSGQQVFTATTNYTRYWTWINTTLSILVDGNLEDQTLTTVYTSTNDDGSTNSKTEEVSVLFGSGPSNNTLGNIQAYDGASWVEGFNWRKGNSGAYVDFGQLLATEILAGQKLAIERYIGEVTGDYTPHSRLQRIHTTTTVNYIFIGGSQNLHRDIWAGEWIQIDIDVTNITEETPLNLYSRFRRKGGPVESRTPNRPGFIPTTEDTGVEIETHDADENGPTQVDISGNIPSGTEISNIPTEFLPADQFFSDGDQVIIVTPTGKELPIIIDGNPVAGDTSIDIVPVTPDFDIPEGSIIKADEVDLLAYVQRSRTKYLRFFSDIRVTDAIIDGNPLFFFRIDESSDLYLNTATSLELQVYTAGSGGGEYDYELKRDSVNIASTTVSETTELSRTSIDIPLVSGLYSFHISGITGTVPTGINFLLKHVEPLQKQTAVNSSQTINGEYPGDLEAFQDGILIGQLYQMSTANYHGMPRGIVIQNYSIIGYSSDTTATVSANQWYAVSAGNAYGMKKGAIRVKGYTGTTYDTDSAAATGGIAIGEYYVLGAANPYGVAKWFIKIRIS